MNCALIFAGGVGSRMNTRATPKQFLQIHGKPILIYTLEQYENHPLIDEICVVVVNEWLHYTESLIQKYGLRKVKWILPGGKSALESQFIGLSAIWEIKREENVVVLIHDGVRPLVDEENISDCIDSVKKYGSGVTVVPAIETIIKVDNQNNISQTIPREECRLARAPQAFWLKDIYQAHIEARNCGKYDYVDSTSLMIANGFTIHTVQGKPENIKVTTPADFYICRALLDAKENSQIFGL